ncbi:MAG: hypothetical protein MZW92_46095 [Comamonadaceae bacterium]|nr:hypothetical protein [Comamonadaceae bacterium]
MLSFDLLNPLAQRLVQPDRQWHHAVLPALGVANRDALITEVHILNTQPHTLHQAQLHKPYSRLAINRETGSSSLASRFATSVRVNTTGGRRGFPECANAPSSIPSRLSTCL